ncbi:MAG TPA: CDP-diacylglycerol--serine O-phosphatidyltransferase [Bacteroidales bacterium]|nr:CDP-diacylglycerol--serine O-phosphatidyltransferase [Bacteroidales bacterium]HPT22117.1 CDP-diacylglycerol--serine O-phosphatidyltransferase [Bacteroidales bacterium]
MTKHIPNFITSLNLTSGFIAITFAANGQIVTASWLILAAMIFDFMDGFSARLLKKYSEIGKELDSLADVVSFGVAPGFIIYQLLMKSLSSAPVTGLQTVLILAVAAIMAVCAALRLAKFNIDTTQATTFRGLPTPACAIGVISVVISAHYSQSPVFNTFLESPAALAVFSIVLSLLMVTRIPLLSLKVKSLKFKGNEGRYILIGSVLLSFAILGISAAPLIIPLYLIASLLSPLF